MEQDNELNGWRRRKGKKCDQWKTTLGSKLDSFGARYIYICLALGISFAGNWVIWKKLSTRVATRWVVYTLMCSNRVNKLKCHFGFILFAFLAVFFLETFQQKRKKEGKSHNLLFNCDQLFVLGFKDAGVFAFYTSNSYRGEIKNKNISLPTCWLEYDILCGFESIFVCFRLPRIPNW